MHERIQAAFAQQVSALAEAHDRTATASNDGTGCGSAFVLRMSIVVARVMNQCTTPDLRAISTLRPTPISPLALRWY
jgi:hypothetical protein